MKVLFIGGFASNSAQLRFLQRELEKYFSAPVSAKSLRYALTHRDEIIALSQDAIVLMHSAGVLAAPGMKPRCLWIIAPPRLATRRRDLLTRSTQKTIDLWRGAFKSRHRLARVAKYHLYAAPEVLCNLFFYVKLLKKVSIFDLTSTVDSLKHRRAYVVHMTKDSLYSHKITQEDIMVEGEHDEILLHPIEVVRAARIQPMVE